MMVWDFDDFGANHILSDQCQSHDCRDALQMLKEANPNFKVTLFTMPMEMTMELIFWATENADWVELAYHGFFHRSNYECEKMDYDTFDSHMNLARNIAGGLFVKGFKAPGWQISDDSYKWLQDNGFWVADQAYNNSRRPQEIPAYVVDGSVFVAHRGTGPISEEFTEVEAWHGHTWDCVGNGIYETLPQLLEQIKGVQEFKFVSEVLS